MKALKIFERKKNFKIFTLKIQFNKLLTISNLTQLGYIDIGDEFWRQNVMLTFLGRFGHKKIRSKIPVQDLNFVTIIQRWQLCWWQNHYFGDFFRYVSLQLVTSSGSSDECTSLSVSPCFWPKKHFFHVKDLILELYKLWISGRLVVLGLFIILTPQSGQRNIIIYINIILLYYIIYILWKGYTPDPSLLPFPASNILKIFSKMSKTSFSI